MQLAGTTFGASTYVKGELAGGWGERGRNFIVMPNASAAAGRASPLSCCRVWDWIAAAAAAATPAGHVGSGGHTARLPLQQRSPTGPGSTPHRPQVTIDMGGQPRTWAAFRNMNQVALSMRLATMPDFLLWRTISLPLRGGGWAGMGRLADEGTLLNTMAWTGQGRGPGGCSQLAGRSKGWVGATLLPPLPAGKVRQGLETTFARIFPFAPLPTQVSSRAQAGGGHQQR